MPKRLTAALVRRAGVLAELGVALVAVSGMLLSSTSIDVDPLDRIGQVSGLAALQLRFVIGAFALLAGLLIALRFAAEERFRSLVPLACASLAGLLGGLVGGGVIVALRGTPFGLCANGGDAGVLQDWASGLLAGKPMPTSYPPLAVYATAAWAKVTDQPPAYAFRDLQIAGIALLVPFAYFAWRRLSSAPWALGIGVTALLPLLHPYKAYEQAVLVALVPLFALLLEELGRRERTAPLRTVAVGVAFGGAFAVLCLGYSGWFLWSAPGALVALAVWLLNDQTNRRRPLLLLACAGVAFLLVTHEHVFAMLGSAGKMKDTYFYFDVYTEPSYIAGWRDGLPGSARLLWPPHGELGGVGVFSLLLALGLGAALALGLRHPVVVTAALFAAGAWALRFLIASRMYATQSVQLYPRTSAEILYCLLLLAGFAVHLLVRRHALSLDRGALVGVLAALTFVYGSAGSATADRFMPRDDASEALLAFYAQTAPDLSGRCSRYTRPGQAGTIKPGLPKGWRTCKPVTATPAGFDPRRERTH